MGRKSISESLREEASNPDPPSADEMRQQVYAIPPDEYRNREMARIKAEAAALNSDETVEGGRYQIGEKLFNAHGEEIGAEKKDESKDEE